MLRTCLTTTRIIGHEDLRMLEAVLDGDRLLSDESQNHLDEERVAA